MNSTIPITNGSHEQWHVWQRDLADLVLAAVREHAGMLDHPFFAGNLCDDLWEWMRYNLPGGHAFHDCDWCECEVAARLWEPCPRCGGPIPTAETPGAYPGALSRVDNETEVCSRCGSVEAVGEAVTAAAEAALAEAKAERIAGRIVRDMA